MTGAAGDRQTDYAEVIGDPVAHSKSPIIHGFWLDALGFDARYEACHVTPDALADYITGRRDDPLWRGCNVTIPHKLAILDEVADPGGIRSTIGAANTVFRDEGGGLVATNTDAAGFYAPIADVPLDGHDVIVIGSGGAARAVLFALARAAVGSVTLLSRNALKGAALLAQFGLKGRVLAMDARLPRASLLVNASPLGMTGQLPLHVDLGPLRDEAIVYDLVYVPLVTDLLDQADARGLVTIDGLDMLMGQAALAFELFFGVPPPRDADDALRERLLA